MDTLQIEKDFKDLFANLTQNRLKQEQAQENLDQTDDACLLIYIPSNPVGEQIKLIGLRVLLSLTV